MIPKTFVVKTKYKTDDVVICGFSIKDFGAAGDGNTDDTLAFQNALKAGRDCGGTVIFVPEGNYKITGNLTIPTGVTLRGDWESPNAVGIKGTVLQAYAGKGNEDEATFISMEYCSGVTNLSIWYPEQQLNGGTVIPYPWTMEQISGNNVTIENVTLVNSYKGIKIGPSSNELHYIKNLYATTLKTGIYIDMTTDIGRVEGVNLSPKYWSNSGLPGSPSGDGEKLLFDYMTTHSEGILMGRSDWEYLSYINIWGYNTGMRLVGSAKTGEGANSQLYRINIDQCNVALRIDAVNEYGTLISDSTLSAGAGESPRIVHTTSGFDTICQFNTVKFGGNPLNAIVNEGPGVLSFENCSFDSWRPQDGGYAIAAKSGSLILGHTTFKHRDNQVLLQGDVSKLTSLNSGSDNVLNVANNCEQAVISITYDEKIKLDSIPEDIRFDIEVRPRPCCDKVYDITASEYGAAKDDSEDVSHIIQKAIDDAALTGGTVYFPAGSYRVDKPITVKKGVELRGMWDVPHHTIGGGSAIITNWGENEPEGAPLITLLEGAGVKGLNIYYDKQDWDNIKPYSWSIQGKGKNVYAINTTIVNSYKGVDFGTYDCSGHYIDYVGGSPLYHGINVGNSNEGYVRNVQFNPHYCSRSNYHNSAKGNQWRTVWEYQKNYMDAFSVGSVTNEKMFNNFVFGSQYGLHFMEQDGKGASAIIMGHGTDGSTQGIRIETAGEEGLVFINSELVNLGTLDRVYIHVEKGFNSKATFINTACWGDPSRSMDIYSGKVSIQQCNIVNVGSVGINVVGGEVGMYNCLLQETDKCHIRENKGAGKITEANNIYGTGMVGGVKPNIGE